MSVRRIAVVDDQQDILALVRLAIQIDTDWDVQTYETVEAAADGGAVDVVLLDLSVAGDEPTASINRLNEATQHAPVILLTASPIPIAEARSLGAFGLIKKPFDVTTLAEEIDALLS